MTKQDPRDKTEYLEKRLDDCYVLIAEQRGKIGRMDLSIKRLNHIVSQMPEPENFTTMQDEP